MDVEKLMHICCHFRQYQKYCIAMSKKLLGNPLPPNYVVITSPSGGHTGQTAGYITLQQAKKLLKDESIVVYVFKVPRMRYGNNQMLKYPLGEYYSALEINVANEDVYVSMNDENLKNNEKDFAEYIELVSKYDEDGKQWVIDIVYHDVK